MPDDERSCLTCPHRLSADEAAIRFKKGLGAPQCDLFGHVLGKPGLKPIQEAMIAKHFAKDCPSYGTPRGETCCDEPSMAVAIADPRVVIAGEPDVNERNRVGNCRECANFIPAEIVKAKFGWSFPMCRARGDLLNPSRLTSTARNCSWRKPGGLSTDVSTVFLSPIYDEAFGAGLDPVAAFMKRQRDGAAVVDPRDYPTDKDVTPAWAKLGVRAWRRIEDPSGSGKFTHLPIFNDTDDLLEAAKIPRTGSNKHPELYVDHSGLIYKVAACWMEFDFVPFLWGRAGTGKTELFRHLAWLMNLPFDNISIKPETTLDNLLGHAEAKEGTTYFIEGRVPKRWTRPGVFLLDEVNCNANVSFLIRPLGDENQELVLDEDAAQVLPRNLCCFFGMAANPAWDPLNFGTLPIAPADMSRAIHMDAVIPAPEVEREILKAKALALDEYEVPDAVLTTIMKIAAEIRAMADDGALPISWGIRDQQQVVRLTKMFTLEDAYRLAIANALEPQQREDILSIVKTNNGGSPSADMPF
jgi:MoxR-like ATPase